MHYPCGLPRLLALPIAIQSAVIGCASLERQPAAAVGQPVSFVTSDSITLRGHLYGYGSTGVILAHMFPADQQDWSDFARILAAQGYQALTFDFRGFSESDGSSGVERAGDDLEAAYNFLRPRTNRIFLIGASMGADASILVAAREPAAGVVAISPPIKFRGLDVSVAITEVKAPILLITSTQDSLVTGEPEALYKSASTPSKSLGYVAGHAHGTDMLRGPYGADVEHWMLAFIRANDHSPPT
jgi:alpha-beta hydrolase superfamily lysophospholipase